jgi:hypothetical protein
MVVGYLGRLLFPRIVQGQNNVSLQLETHMHKKTAGTDQNYFNIQVGLLRIALL